MKKFLAILLSIIMVFSCATVAFAADDTGTEEGTLIDKIIDKLQGVTDLGEAMNSLPTGSIIPNEYLSDGEADVEAIIASGLIDDIDLLGLSVDFLYNSKDSLAWPALKISKGDVALVKANLNVALSKVVKRAMGDARYDELGFFTAENASALINFIGHLLNPYFEDVALETIYVPGYEEYTYDSYITKNVFYAVVAKLSGLTDTIDANWCKQMNVNYNPILYMLGFNYNDDSMLGKSKLSNAQRVAPVLVRSVFEQIDRLGPLEYILRIVSQICATYNATFIEPIKALLKAHIVAGTITEEELGTLKGLLNLVVNGNDKNDTTKLQFINAPSYRFALCTKNTSKGFETDTTEMFLYSIIYTNLVGLHGSNKTAVKKMEYDIMANDKLKSEQKDLVVQVYEGAFLGNMAGLMESALSNFITNITDTPHNIAKVFTDYLINFMRSIANFFAKIFDSFKNFGKF